MNNAFKYSLSVAFMLLAIGCAKTESADGGSAPTGQTTIPGNCVPNQFGGVPAGCPIPSTANAVLRGDLYRASEYSIIPLLKNLPGRLESYTFNPYGSSIYQCRTSEGIFGATCLNECKNFRSGAQISVQIVNGSGVVNFRAGPYDAPKLCNRGDNGSSYNIQIPVWIYDTADKKGFIIRSSQAGSYNNGYSFSYPNLNAGFNKLFSIEVPVGTLASTTVKAKVLYDGNFLGDIDLYKTN